MNELRRDPITGNWVILATRRDQRPNEFQGQVGTDADSSACPFCAGQMATPPVVASYGGSAETPWEVCVVPNLYPAMTKGSFSHVSGTTLFEKTIATGRHEVVIESPSHVTSPGNLTQEQVQLLLIAYRDRMRFMRDSGEVACALPIKNYGPEAGASLEHCHSQIFGLPLVPPVVSQELTGAMSYKDRTGQCVFCDLIQASEVQDHVIATTDTFIAWCPFASRVNFEVWIAPREHGARFEASTDDSLEDLAILLRQIMRKLEHHERIEAFNYIVHSLPFDMTRDDHYHWHIEIIPRTSKMAGFEWGAGIHICTVAPKQAAAQLRRQV